MKTIQLLAAASIAAMAAMTALPASAGDAVQIKCKPACNIDPSIGVIGVQK